jgi:hypothetical protein
LLEISHLEVVAKLGGVGAFVYWVLKIPCSSEWHLVSKLDLLDALDEVALLVA